MSQGPLCPNLSQKVQKEVSQMANRNLSPVILLGGLSVNLNHLKNQQLLQKYHCRRAACHNIKVNQIVSNKKKHVDSVKNFNTQKRIWCQFKQQKKNNEQEQINRSTV